MDVSEQVLKLVSEGYQAKDRIVSPNTTFAALRGHIDALALRGIEQYFGIEITRDEFRDTRTVGELIALVASKVH